MLHPLGELLPDEVLEVFPLFRIALNQGVQPVGLRQVLFWSCVAEQVVHNVVTVCIAVFAVHSAEEYGLRCCKEFVNIIAILDVRAGHLAVFVLHLTDVLGSWVGQVIGCEPVKGVFDVLTGNSATLFVQIAPINTLSFCKVFILVHTELDGRAVSFAECGVVPAEEEHRMGGPPDSFPIHYSNV